MNAMLNVISKVGAQLTHGHCCSDPLQPIGDTTMVPYIFVDFLSPV